MVETFGERELQRLETLHALRILDTPGEQAYDDIVLLASQICGTPIAAISLVDTDRQWFKAKVGLDAPQTPRDQAFCAHAILEPRELMVVPDASQDLRFITNPLVTGDTNIRFYAGAPVLTDDGKAVGTLCVIDNVPREFTDGMRLSLQALSRQVSELLQLRQTNAILEQIRTELHKANSALQEQALTDGLTGTRNRRSLDAKLVEERDRSLRQQTPLVVMLIDIDLFKAVNDSFGHLVGDDVLRSVAQGIGSQARSYDHVARFGGEEFAVVLPATGMTEAMAVAQRIRACVQTMADVPRPVTVSIGVALWDGESTVDVLLQQADQALYQAKQQGRNQVSAFTPPAH
jgi:diguanylate cyclase (GGDEF)-like protein